MLKDIYNLVFGWMPNWLQQVLWFGVAYVAIESIVKSIVKEAIEAKNIDERLDNLETKMENVRKHIISKRDKT